MKRVLVGRPMATGQMEDTLLSKFLALPVFASDPLSSVAYATEAALVVLVGVSATAGHLVLPVSVAIALLLAIVVISYTQTVRAYETSGGAYVVAKDNLGTLPSLVAAAALLTDYILTVAVSVAAGIVAITSAAPSLYPYRVWLCLGCIVAPHGGEPARRCVRPAGSSRSRPTASSISLFAVIGAGVAKCATEGCPQATVSHPVAAGTGTVTLFVLLRAFASGSAALTGVESISNGVTAFKRPQSKNAAETLAIMGVIAITLFIGVSWLAVKMHARPSETTSVLSQIAHGVFPTGGMYYVVQGFTLAILILAANSSYQGFPRLAALLARDRFFPRQFVNLGDRLVYSNGIVLVAGLASALIVIFAANVDSLLHLYVLGVFTAFTLSQYGMVRYWRRTRDRGWQWRAAVNGRRGGNDAGRDARRDPDEVHGGRLGGHGRDPVDGRRVLRDAKALPPRRPPPEGRRRSCCRGTAGDERSRPVRRVVRQRAARGGVVRARHLRRLLPRRQRTRPAQRPGTSRPLPAAHGHPSRPRSCCRRTKGGSRL